MLNSTWLWTSGTWSQTNLKWSGMIGSSMGPKKNQWSLLQTFEGWLSIIQRCNQELSQTMSVKKTNLKTRDCWNMTGLTSCKRSMSVKFTLYQMWRGTCMHPGSRLTSHHFIANSLLLCLFRTSFYSGSQGWGPPFYRSIYGALGGQPSTFYSGKPVL